MADDKRLPAHLEEKATEAIQGLVEFHFEGQRRSHTNFLTAGGLKRVVYYTYGYRSYDASDPARLVWYLVEDIRKGLNAVDDYPLCLIWRWKPRLERNVESDRWKIITRFGVVNTKFEQVVLPISHIVEGSLIPELPPKNSDSDD